MKVGDTFKVKIGEWEVADAMVEDIEDDKVTLLIPATRVTMGLSHSLADLPEEVPEVERTHTLLPADGGGSDAIDDANQSLADMDLDSSDLD